MGPTTTRLFRLIALGSDELKKQGYTRIKQEVVVGPMPQFGTILKTSDQALEDHYFHPLGQSGLGEEAAASIAFCRAAAASALIFGKPPSLLGLGGLLYRGEIQTSGLCGDANAGIKITAPWQAIY